MDDKLQIIVGRNVLNGESGSSDVVLLAKALKYLTYQIGVIKKSVDEDTKDYIDDVIDRATEILA